MTIAAGFRFADGILLCADTQITYEGIAKVSGTKILPFEFKRSALKVVFTFSGDVSYAKGGIKACVRKIKKLEPPTIALEDVESAISESLNSYFQNLVYKHPHYKMPGGPDFWLIVGIWSPKDGLGLYETADAVVTKVSDGDKFAMTGIGATLGRYLAKPMMLHSGYSMSDIGTVSTHFLSEVKEHVDGCGKGSELIVLSKDGLFSSIGGLGTAHIEDVFGAIQNSINLMFLDLCDLEKPGDEAVVERLKTLHMLVVSCRQHMLKEAEKHRGMLRLLDILMGWKVRKIE